MTGEGGWGANRKLRSKQAAKHSTPAAFLHVGQKTRSEPRSDLAFGPTIFFLGVFLAKHTIAFS